MILAFIFCCELTRRRRCAVESFIVLPNREIIRRRIAFFQQKFENYYKVNATTEKTTLPTITTTTVTTTTATAITRTTVTTTTTVKTLTQLNRKKPFCDHCIYDCKNPSYYDSNVNKLVKLPDRFIEYLRMLSDKRSSMTGCVLGNFHSFLIMSTAF
jgi:hypothetical protein